MIDFLSLLKTTDAYKVLLSDKRQKTLSHAYMIVCADKEYLGEYLKIFAQVLACNEDEPCLSCRTCELIKRGAHVDVLTFPEGDTVVVNDINTLIEQSYVKPFESDKKIFIVNHGETINTSAQNKLLKTLEEPPKNVYILLGTTSEYPILHTVKSRVKKLVIPSFDSKLLYSALSKDYPEQDKLKNAIFCSDGTVGKTVELYGDKSLFTVIDFVCDMIVNMQSSKDILDYVTKFNQEKIDFNQLLTVLNLTFREMLVGIQNEKLVGNIGIYNRVKGAKGYNTGALIYAIDKVMESVKRKKFNTNQTMLLDWLMFQILEGKYKWQKF